MRIASIVATNSFYQFISRFIAAVSTLTVTLLITRNLSRDVWGDFVIVTSYLGLFTIISDFGINAIFVKEASKDETKLATLFSNLLSLRLVLSLISIFLALAVLTFLPHSSAVKVGIIVGSVIILLQGVFTTNAALFQQKLRYSLFAISDILGSLTIIALIFIASLTNASLLVIILIVIAGNLVKSLVGLAFVKKILQKIELVFDFDIWKLLFFSSIPLGAVLILSQFNASIDKQIIALTSSEKLGVSAAVAVGIYGLSYRVFDFIIAIAAFFSNALYPILLSELKENREKFEDLSKKSVAVAFLFGSAIAVILWFIAPFLLSFFGKYEESLTSLRILLLGTPLFFASSVMLWVNITIGKEKLLPFIYGFALMINFSLNLAFIPRFGYNFAAWSTVISEAVILVLLGISLIYNSKPSHEAPKD